VNNKEILARWMVQIGLVPNKEDKIEDLINKVFKTGKHANTRTQTKAEKISGETNE